MRTTCSRPAVLIAAMASVALLSTLIAGPAGSADRFQQLAGKMKLPTNCPPARRPKCDRDHPLACAKRRGICCTKWICSIPH